MSLLLTGFESLAEIGINMWLGGVGIGGCEAECRVLRSETKRSAVFCERSVAKPSEAQCSAE